MIGIAVLVFSILGYFGNFVQWSDAQQTTATILNSDRQWLRHGAGNLNLDIQYYANMSLYSKTVSISPSNLQEGEAKIQVYYMGKKPHRVIPVAVLKGKQKNIHITFAAGCILTVIGIVLGIVNKKKIISSNEETIVNQEHLT